MTKEYDIIKRPIITEKTNKELEENKYTFACDKKANKIEIKNAIEKIFGVKVVKVNTITVLPKHKRVGQYSGFKAGYKKAVITLSADSKKIPGFEL